MPGPDFPNVPKADGVPAVNRDASNPGTDTAAALNSDAITVTATGRNEWGVYTAGNAKALDPDTIMAIGYDAEHRIADFPIEEGGFESYDKVALPFETRVVMTKGGSIEDRRAFLAAVDDIRGDMKLYNVVTPERTYLKVNFEHVSIDRSRESGAGLITVELRLKEIRQNATATFSNSKEPASADTKSDGAVQAKDATSDLKAAVESKVAAVAPVTAISGAGKFFDSAAGMALKSIPLVAGLPSQVLTTNIASQAVQVVLSQKRTGLFADVSLGGAIAAAGVLCRDGVPLLPKLPTFPGNLALFDLQGANDPDFTGLGERFQMLWAG